MHVFMCVSACVHVALTHYDNVCVYTCIHQYIYSVCMHVCVMAIKIPGTHTHVTASETGVCVCVTTGVLHEASEDLPSHPYNIHCTCVHAMAHAYMHAELAQCRVVNNL